MTGVTDVNNADNIDIQTHKDVMNAQNDIADAKHVANDEGMTSKIEKSLPNGHGDLPNGNIENESSNDDKTPDGVTELPEDGSTDKTTQANALDSATDKATEITQEAAAEGQEVVLIQDTGFTIQIVCPGMEPFDLPVSSMELVQEIYQVLVDKEDTCHRTCFSIQLDGVTMDNFAELKIIEGLEEGSVVKVVEEPYTVREARIHVRHIRDLLKSVDNVDAYNGLDCNSLSFLNVVSSGNLEKKAGKIESIDCTPPDYIMPGSKERPLTPLHPTLKDQKAPQCLKVLTFSGWNPPPGNRRMHGDLLYLYVLTMEDKRYHITASTRGFFVNISTQDEFNPKPALPKHCPHSLIDLLNQISPTFKRNFQILLKKRVQKHPFERVATPYQVYSWLAPNLEHTIDSIRAEDAFSSRLGYEEHIPGQTRDWNEELQTTREMPRKNLPERLIRERAIFKVHSDFVVAATRGAMAVIDGNIMAINPGEDAKMQMFLWNNIFFSLGFDVKDHYKDFGGDAAAYVAPGSDLQGVKAYSSVDLVGLFTLGTVVVDYRGYRVTAQSIIPGILEKEQEQSVVYGSIDFGNTVVTHDKYRELLQKTAQALKFCPHKVINNKDEEIELLSSVECKGIIGNDGRHYVLDMLRTFPPDVNYLDISEEISPAMKSLGYPKKHKHSLACLRQELIDAFYDNHYVIFVKHAAFHLQQIRAQKLQEEKEKAEKEKDAEPSTDHPAITSEEDIETEVAKKIIKELATDGNDIKEESSTKDVVKKAAQSVGSLSDTEFVVAFNTNVFQPHVKHVDPDGETHKKEKQLVKDASEFLVIHQIPNFIRDCLEHTSSPIDGYTLTEAMHHNGINMRYLGTVTEMVAKYDQLSYLHSICVLELITRALKHLYKAYMQGVGMTSLSAAISHLLNCMISSCPSPHTQVATEELQGSRARKRNKKKSKLIQLAQDSMEWATETPKSLWKKATDEIEEYYDYKLDCDSLEAAIDKYNLQKISLLRLFCKRVGIQILLREYQFDSKTKQTFFEEDILNTFPIVKHIHPKASDAYHVFTSGQTKIQQGLLREGYELISEALNLLNNVYGAMHPEIAACARLLARLNYIMGDYQEALLYQQRAVLMSERVLGVDHPNTITEYAHLALYCFANNQIPTALKLMYRARYLALSCHGESHPEVALFDSNIGLILQAVGEFDLSLRFLEKALELNNEFNGKKSLKVAMSYHLVARTHSCKGDFRTALHNEKEAYTIYKQLLGEEHERTKESTECLRHLTQQAVKFQKTMNQISKGEKISSIPPLQIQTPSLSNVLDTLNLINGIVFVHISQEDIERFREEMLRRQQNKPGANNSDEQKSAQAEITDSDNSNAKDSGSKDSNIKDTNVSDSNATDHSAIDTNATDTGTPEEEAMIR